MGLRHQGFRRKATGLWEAASPLPQCLWGTTSPQQRRRLPWGQTGVPRHTETSWKRSGTSKAAAVGAGQGLPGQVPSVPTQPLSGLSPSQGHCSSAAPEQPPPTDTVWAQGRKQGSEALTKPDCARPALGTGRSMGYKQPRELLRRGVNKGISEDISGWSLAGGRDGTIPTLAHNREQPSPSIAPQPGWESKKPRQCRGGGTRGAVSPSAGGSSGAGLGQPLHRP